MVDGSQDASTDQHHELGAAFCVAKAWIEGISFAPSDEVRFPRSRTIQIIIVLAEKPCDALHMRPDDPCILHFPIPYPVECANLPRSANSLGTD